MLLLLSYFLVAQHIKAVPLLHLKLFAPFLMAKCPLIVWHIVYYLDALDYAPASISAWLYQISSSYLSYLYYDLLVFLHISVIIYTLSKDYFSIFYYF